MNTNTISKVIMYSLMIIGLALCILACGRMLLLFESFITTDKQFLLCLFGGIGICCMGFLVESYRIEPVNWYQEQQKVRAIRSMWTAVVCCAILLTMVQVGLQ